MDVHSLVTCWGLSVVMFLIGIDGLVWTRLFQGHDVPILNDESAPIIDEVYAASHIACALHCAKPECAGFLFRESDAQWPDDYCYDTPDHFGYTGQRNITVNGRTCQRWDSQIPQDHDTNNASFVPESSFTEAQNYCRDMDDSGLVWCYTMDSCCRWEACDVTKCIATGKNCRLYNATSVPYRTWSGYSYYQGVDD